MNFKRSKLATAIFLYSSAAFGGDLAVTGDSVRFEAGSYDETETIGADGIVSAATGIPAAAITSDLSLSFAMESSDTANGVYNFEVGMFIDHDNSQRRLEIFIPNVIMEFTNSGATLNGSIPSSGIDVFGRSADGSITLSATTTNSAFSFTGNSLAIDTGNQVDKIEAAGGILADLIATFDTENQGHYSYGVFLAQTGGPEALTFSTDGGTALPCAPAAPFAINTAKNSTFAGSSALQGEIEIDGATDGNSETPTAYSGSCTPMVTSVPVTGTIDTVPLDPTQVSDEEVTLVVAELTTLITAVNSDPNAAGVVAVQLGKTTGVIEKGVTTTEFSVNSDTAANALDAIGNQVAAGRTSLTAFQKDEVKKVGTAIVQTGEKVAATTTNLDETRNVKNTMQKTLNAMGKAGVTMSAEIAAATQSTSSELGNKVREQAGMGTIDEVKADPTKLQRLLKNSKISQKEYTKQDGPSTKDKLRTANPGASTEVVEKAGDLLANTVNPNSQISGTLGSEDTPINLVKTVTLGQNLGVDINVDDDTGELDIDENGTRLKGIITDVSFVPDDLGESVIPEPNGNVTITRNGMAVTATPGPRNTMAYVSAANKSGLTPSIDDSGQHVLSTDDNSIVAHGRFPWSPSADTAGDGDIVGLPVPGPGGYLGGETLGAGTYVGVQYDDGNSQPMAAGVAGFSNVEDTILDAGWGYQIDPNTGLIRLTTDGGVDGGSFQPDYLSTPTNDAELDPRLAPPDGSDIGFTLTDQNGDGADDLTIATPDGSGGFKVQSLFFTGLE